ncbi:MAG: hypothetical protein ACRD2G_14445 [Terriglobia bacterium]
MKKYVREILDDLMKKDSRDFLPSIPQAPTDGKKMDLDPPQQPPLEADLNNEELPGDPAQRVKQLDYQAQKNEERETLE